MEYFVDVFVPETADKAVAEEFVKTIFHLENETATVLENRPNEDGFTYYVSDAWKSELIPDKFTKSNDISFTVGTGNKELDGIRILIGHIGE